MIADRLPQQLYRSAPAGRIVRSSLPGLKSTPDWPITVPAHSKVNLLIRRDSMISAYPALTLSSGAGATVKLTYAEALYDANRHKGDRDEIGDRQAIGISDSFRPDGTRYTFARYGGAPGDISICLSRPATNPYGSKR